MSADPILPGPAAARLEPPVDDAVLAARAAGGDREAFEGLYRRHAARVHGPLVSLVSIGLITGGILIWERRTRDRGEGPGADGES